MESDGVEVRSENMKFMYMALDFFLNCSKPTLPYLCRNLSYFNNIESCF